MQKKAVLVYFRVQSSGVTKENHPPPPNQDSQPLGWHSKPGLLYKNPASLAINSDFQWSSLKTNVPWQLVDLSVSQSMVTVWKPPSYGNWSASQSEVLRVAGLYSGNHGSITRSQSTRDSERDKLVSHCSVLLQKTQNNSELELRHSKGGREDGKGKRQQQDGRESV
jgi:hypothetical protein